MKKTLAFLLLAAACLVASPLLAQSTTQGAIGGTVFDSTDAVVPKAGVTIHNTGTNAEIHVVADDSGAYKASLVEPGTYTVTIAATGFEDYRAKDVIVQVGEVTTVSPHLTTGSSSQVVEVTADALTLNYDSPDIAAVLDQKALSNIPIQNRRWSAPALTTPGVVADSSGFGLVSVRGMSTLLNNVEIDGADDNQAYFSEERGRTREGYSTSANAVREFQVNTGVYSAQYGRAGGGVINSVTKSGTNAIHGVAHFDDLDRGFGGYVPGALGPTQEPLKPKDLRKIYGFSAGGPILKNKLFWFYTYDQLDHINPGIAYAKQYGSPTTVGTFLEQPDLTVTVAKRDQVFAEETDEFAAYGGRDSAPFEKGGVSLRDGFGCIGSGDGRELRDDFAGEWGVDDEGSVEWSGNAEMSENFGDFGLDGHYGLGLA